jgi:DNA-binding transcriptional LysR family regulator
MSAFDPDLLRTFLAFADTGSLARAASIVGRTPSAVTAQMQRLEGLAGEPLLMPEGRGRRLTPAGQTLARHARTILAAHQAAWLDLKGARADGTIALGLTQDFAETLLPTALPAFLASHPRVRLDLRVGRSREMAIALAEGRLDLLLAARLAVERDEVLSFHEPTAWLATDTPAFDPEADLPLALLDSPCAFRDAALAALEASGRPFRIAASSASLSGILAAVRAGMAVTLRLPRSAGAGITQAPAALHLPETPPIAFSIRCRPGSSPAATTLATLLAAAIAR